MAKQGKCDNCKILWTWKHDKIPLRYKQCPVCGRSLRRGRAGSMVSDYPARDISEAKGNNDEG